MGEQKSLFYILKKFFKKDIQGHNSRESKETSGGFVKTWQILPKTKCKSLLPSFTKSYQIVTFTEHSTLHLTTFPQESVSFLWVYTHSIIKSRKKYNLGKFV